MPQQCANHCPNPGFLTKPKQHTIQKLNKENNLAIPIVFHDLHNVIIIYKQRVTNCHENHIRCQIKTIFTIIYTTFIILLRRNGFNAINWM